MHKQAENFKTIIDPKGGGQRQKEETTLRQSVSPITNTNYKV